MREIQIMKATIKSIHIENFKGIKDRTLELGNYSRLIEGRNAEGKTTLADAYMWLFSDKDMSLKSNPDIKPLGVAECIPTVAVVLTVDGKDIEFCKMQKIKCSEPDENGVRKVSASNSYMINSVLKNERDFKAYIEEIGLPKDNDFLIMSHTSVFTSMKTADMRNILFSMVSEVSDLEVAEKTEGVSDLKALLENYKLEEIEAMQKASKKKAEDQLKNIPGQIEGLELAKTENVDTAEAELLVANIKEQIATEQAKLDEIRKERDTFATLCQTGLSLEFDRNSEIQKMNDKAMAGRKEIESNLNNAQNDLITFKREIRVCNDDIEHTQKRIDAERYTFEGLKNDYECTKSLSFDDKSTICPVCNRPFEAEKVEEIKKSFEADKKSKMDEINHKAKEVQQSISEFEKLLDGYKAKLDEANTKLDQAEKKVAALEKQLEDFKPSEVEKTPELLEIEKKIAENDKAKSEIKSHNNDENTNLCNQQISQLQAQLDEANKTIGANANNIRIDEQIEELENKRIELEQAKADCERILYQIDCFSKKRNELLTDEINKHFKKVRFQLFEYLKNGNYKECCIPLSLDSKPLGVATNTALEVEMKMDICQAFQRYHDTMIPLWIDGAECFSSDSYNNLECETQHIYLKVADCDLTLR